MQSIPQLPPDLCARSQAVGLRLYFEDIREGDWFDSAETSVDESSVISFAKAWDPQPFHIDKDLAERSLFGGLSASGLQTILLTYKLYIDLGLFDGTALAGLGLNNVLFKAPLRPDDRIHVRAVIASARRSSKPERAVVKVALHTFNQIGEEIASLELTMLLACRSKG
ncbi:MaoC family dehydratase N-terminal domain-containing protein [Alcaligenaceae bacterium]|nr:MaoC family dehydratase N-terminal domain-containing protein [Alcaligenaceae bacterium]